METNDYRYYLYARRSTDDVKQALSTKSQVDELQPRFGHLNIIEVIQEDGSSFKPYCRPKFMAMMKNIEEGKADGIITWHPDRLSRNPIDAAQVLYALDRGVIKDIQFGSYHFDNSPEGKMMLGISLSQSKYYSEKLAKDVMRGMNAKCTMGHKPAKALLGYRNVKTQDRGKSYIERDDVRFPQVRRMWDLLLSEAYSVPDIWKIAVNEWGLTMPASKKLLERKVSLPTVYKIFNSDFYTGYFIWNGAKYKGEHEAMITTDEFERAQVILGRKSKHRNKRRSFPFTGCIHCGECGGMITAEAKQKILRKTNKVATYVYYHCSHKKGPCSQRKCIREENLVDILRPYVEAIQVSPRLAEWVRKQLEQMTAEDQKIQTKQREDIKRKYENCSSAIQNLVKLFVSPDNGDKSLVSDDEFKNQKEELKHDRDRYRALLTDNDKNIDASIERTIDCFDFAAQALKQLDEGDDNAKRLVLMTIGQNWILKDGELEFEPRFPFAEIKEGLESEHARQSRVELKEPETERVMKDKILTPAGGFDYWWPRSGSN